MDWTEITAEEFDALPKTAKPSTPSEWDPIMERLEAGTPVRIPVADAADQKKKRLSVGRRAAMRGFEVEIRYEVGAMAVRRGADREKLRAGRLPKPVAEKAHELVGTARERLARHEGAQDDGPFNDAPTEPPDDGLTADPAPTDGPFGDAPAGAEDAAPKPASRRRKPATS